MHVVDQELYIGNVVVGVYEVAPDEMSRIHPLEPVPDVGRKQQMPPLGIGLVIGRPRPVPCGKSCRPVLCEPNADTEIGRQRSVV